MKNPVYYRASGRSSVLSLPFVLCGALPAALLLAVAYAYAIVYIPIAGYVSFILSAGFGALVGVCAGYAAKRGKVRSEKLAVLYGLGVAFCAYYFHWVVWCYATLQRGEVDVSFMALWLFPPALWEVITTINETGAWTLFHSTPTGWMLWTLWFMEALFIFVPALLLAAGMVTQPFCEACDLWCEGKLGVAHLSPHDFDEVRTHAEAKDFKGLSALGSVHAEAPARLRVDVWNCPRCRDMNTLSIHSIVRTTDDKGKVSEDTTGVVEHLLITRSEVEHARALAQVPLTMSSPGQPFLEASPAQQG